MAWVPLTLNASTPPILADFIRTHLEMQLRDVHSMLRLPVRRAGPGLVFEEGLEAGCNFAAANWLLALVSGVSTLVYPQLKSVARFKKLLQHFYPWEPEACKEDDIKEVYESFRNPLAHALGIQTDNAKTGVKRRVMSGALGVGKQGMPEDLVERLERARQRPPDAASTISRASEGGKTLSVEGLYWGVRVMIEQVTADPQATASAVQFLQT